MKNSYDIIEDAVREYFNRFNPNCKVYRIDIDIHDSSFKITIC